LLPSGERGLLEPAQRNVAIESGVAVSREEPAGGRAIPLPTPSLSAVAAVSCASLS